MLHVKHTLTKPYITNDFIYMSTSLFCNIMILGGPFTAKKTGSIYGSLLVCQTTALSHDIFEFKECR